MRRRTIGDLADEIHVNYMLSLGQYVAILNMVETVVQDKANREEIMERLLRRPKNPKRKVADICASNMDQKFKVEFLTLLSEQIGATIRMQNIISMLLRPAAATANAVRKPEQAVQQIREGLKRAADAAEAFAKKFPQKVESLQRTMPGEIVTHFRRLTRFFIS